MEKTVVVVAASALSAASCGQTIAFDLSLGKGKSAAAHSRSISKTLWTCCVESVTEYCRITFDLFPDRHQLCVAAVDDTKCQPINSWRDEDQEIGKVLQGFQKFGLPQFQGGAGPSVLASCMQGLQYSVRCLAQLTATQYACTTRPGAAPPTNEGRIIFLTALKNAADIKELEKNIVSMVRGENADVKSKNDHARLSIQHCQLAIINTFAPMVHSSDITDSPLTQLSPLVSAVTYSFPARLLLDKCISLAKLHFGLRSTIITGIPMKEEQSGASSANYDVELVHKAEAHRDVQRAGYGLGPSIASKSSKETHGKDAIFLKWSTPKSSALDLQFCTSSFRVTPRHVTARPTVCLINFVLSGKPVLLEQPRKSPLKVVSHVLSSHAGAVFLHCIPASRSFLDEPPSISEGWGGRITDYRITDFSQLVRENVLHPHPKDRTKIPAVFPLQQALAKLERDTRHWPMVFTDTVVYTLAMELEPLLTLVKRDTMSDIELDECKKVILALQAKEAANEQLPIPSSGTRNKGVKRDEQYRLLWSELQDLVELFASSSENHRVLAESVGQAAAHSPGMQLARKTPTGKAEKEGASSHQGPGPAAAATPSELAWQDLDRYQHMSEREKRDFNTGSRNNDHGSWRQPALTPSHPHSLPPHQQKSIPVPAKPIASVLAIWSARQRSKASSAHPEFSGRVSFGRKASLYSSLGSSSVMPPDHDS